MDGITTKITKIMIKRHVGRPRKSVNEMNGEKSESTNSENPYTNEAFHGYSMKQKEYDGDVSYKALSIIRLHDMTSLPADLTLTSDPREWMKQLHSDFCCADSSCEDYHCALCPQRLTQFAGWSLLEDHFIKHHAHPHFMYSGHVIVSCNLMCGENRSSHFHCPKCGNTLRRSNQMNYHLSRCVRQPQDDANTVKGKKKSRTVSRVTLKTTSKEDDLLLTSLWDIVDIAVVSPSVQESNIDKMNTAEPQVQVSDASNMGTEIHISTDDGNLTIMKIFEPTDKNSSLFKIDESENSPIRLVYVDKATGEFNEIRSKATCKNQGTKHGKIDGTGFIEINTRDDEVKPKQEINELITINHVSIVRSLLDLDCQRCQSCCQLFHCPLCPPDIYKAQQPKSLAKHLQTHYNCGVVYEGWTSMKCNLSCNVGCLNAHWHCPLCPQKKVHRSRLREHLNNHSRGRIRFSRCQTDSTDVLLDNIQSDMSNIISEKLKTEPCVQMDETNVQMDEPDVPMDDTDVPMDDSTYNILQKVNPDITKCTADNSGGNVQEDNQLEFFDENSQAIDVLVGDDDSHLVVNSSVVGNSIADTDSNYSEGVDECQSPGPETPLATTEEASITSKSVFSSFGAIIDRDLTLKLGSHLQKFLNKLETTTGISARINTLADPVPSVPLGLDNMRLHVESRDQWVCLLEGSLDQLTQCQTILEEISRNTGEINLSKLFMEDSPLEGTEESLQQSSPAICQLPIEASQPCPYCGKKFRYKNSLFTHVLKVHNIDTEPKVNADIWKFTLDNMRSVTGPECPKCHKAFTTTMLAKIHFGSQACRKINLLDPSSDKDIQVDLVRKDGGLYHCRECSYSTVSRAVLTQHVYSRHAPKTIPCPKCLKLFSTEALLNTHVLRQHSALKFCTSCKVNVDQLMWKYHQMQHKIHAKSVPNVAISKLFADCPLCGRQMYKKNIATHIRTRHKGERRFKCPTCAKTFTTKYTLEMHQQIHLSADQRQYKFICPVCGAGFNTITVYRDHQFTHTNKRPYRCEECGNSFRQKNVYRRHLLVHQPRKYSCSICNQIYTSKFNLKQHEKRHAVAEPEDDDQVYMCMCGTGIVGTSALQKHTQTCVAVSRNNTTAQTANSADSNIIILQSDNKEDLNMESSEIFAVVNDADTDGIAGITDMTLVDMEHINIGDFTVIEGMPGGVDCTSLESHDRQVDYVTSEIINDSCQQGKGYLCGYCKSVFSELDAVHAHIALQHTNLTD